MENNLKEILDRNKINPYDMAKDLKVTVPTVYNWCKTNKLPPNSKWKLISDYLKLDASDIFKI